MKKIIANGIYAGVYSYERAKEALLCGQFIPKIYRWGMHSDTTVLKLLSNESEFGKKKITVFWTTFFFIDP